MNAGSAANPEFLRRAIALATENVLGAKGGPFGAVIVRDGRIVGEGANSVTATSDPTAHAEVNAMRAACRALGTFVLAGWAGFDDSFLYGEFQKDQALRTLPARQMLAEEARASFDAWIASPIKVPY